VCPLGVNEFQPCPQTDCGVEHHTNDPLLACQTAAEDREFEENSVSRSTVPQPRLARQIITAPAGELDIAAVPQLRNALGAAAGGRTHVMLDLGEVTFMDAAALGVIAATAGRIRQAGGKLTILRPAPNVELVLRLTDLHKVLIDATD
jgi:anti-sigma B factor antagonist